jgi:hypothetical protein
MSEEKQEAPEVQEENVAKVSMSLPKKPDETINKVDMSKADEIKDDAVDETGVVGSDETTNATSEQEEVQEEVEAQETPALEEITDEEVVEVVSETLAEPEASVELPASVDKLVEFMNETGGSLEDYVKLNKDVSEMDNLTALQEYYKTTKPHLDSDEIKFLMDESFSFDEELDEEKEIRKKKIALKEQVAEAKAYLDGQKSKYYEEIKAGSRLTPEAKKAMDFFNRYNKESEASTKRFAKVKNVFDKKTNEVFSEEFKGFDYSVGDKKFRFNVKDKDSVKNDQADINNFVKRFLNEDGAMEDASGYHKSLYTAMNADAVAQHFYEQGKADALKSSVAKAKNINMEARKAHNEVNIGGTKFKVLNGDSSSDFKVRIKKGRK